MDNVEGDTQRGQRANLKERCVGVLGTMVYVWYHNMEGMIRMIPCHPHKPMHTDIYMHQHTQHRLMAMGATPALGNGMALPKTTSRQFSSLHVTASPASREMFLNKQGVELHTPGGGKTPASEHAAPWLVCDHPLIVEYTTCIHTQKHMHAHTNTHVHTHTEKHTHARTYTHVHVQARAHLHPSPHPPQQDELKSKNVSSAVHTPDTVNRKNLSNELGQAFAARAQRAGSSGSVGGDECGSASTL